MVYGLLEDSRCFPGENETGLCGWGYDDGTVSDANYYLLGYGGVPVKCAAIYFFFNLF